MISVRYKNKIVLVIEIILWFVSTIFYILLIKGLDIMWQKFSSSRFNPFCLKMGCLTLRWQCRSSVEVRHIQENLVWAQIREGVSPVAKINLFMSCQLSSWQVWAFLFSFNKSVLLYKCRLWEPVLDISKAGMHFKNFS